MQMCLVYDKYQIDSKTVLSVFDIQDLTPELCDILDENFVSICEGDSGSTLEIVKKRIIDLFDGKSDTWVIGSIAEFFIHLYLKLNGYKQECLFSNLEERSIKKGFDGYYSLDGIPWMMESKAGVDTKSNSHKKKVLLAMRNLTDKVAGKDTSSSGKQNNPYRNAYNHASHIDVGTAKNIREQLKQLADDFTNGKYTDISEFNTMPCGSIFCTGILNFPGHEVIKNDIEQVHDKLKGNNIHVICVTYASAQVFLDYLKR